MIKHGRQNRLLVPALILVLTLLTGCASGTTETAEETPPVTPEQQETEAAEKDTEKTENAENTEDSENTEDAEAAEEKPEQVAGADEMSTVGEVVEEGMIPITAESLRDGTYAVTVDSSSEMFRIMACDLTVQEGTMTAVMHMSGTGYRKLFLGTGEEAAAADDSECIYYYEKPDGSHAFTIPVEALDKGLPCAAFSDRKEKWYDRTILFRADSLPAEAFRENVFTTVESLGLADGSYTVAVKLEGGSGKATVASPAEMTVKGGEAVAWIEFSSPNYDYVRIGDTTYLPSSTEGNAAFELPVTAFDRPMTICADTTAMSTPHEIEYTLTFDSASIQQ